MSDNQEIFLTSCDDLNAVLGEDNTQLERIKTELSATTRTHPEYVMYHKEVNGVHFYYYYSVTIQPDQTFTCRFLRMQTA